MTVKQLHLQPGILFALLSAVLFGASTPLAKLLLGNVDPWLLAGLLYLGAGSGLALVHLLRGFLQLDPVEAPLRRSDMPWLAAVVVSGGIVGPLLLMLGLVRSDAAAASLLLNLEGLATMGIAWVIFRENVDRRLLLGAFAILAGAALLSWPGRASFDFGALLIAGACLAWGIDNNLTRKLSSADPVQIAMVKGSGCRNRQPAAFARTGGRITVQRHSPCGRCGRFSWLWRQPCLVRAGAALSRHGANRGVFLISSIYRCRSGCAAAARAVSVNLLICRGADGNRSMAASDRTAPA